MFALEPLFVFFKDLIVNGRENSGLLHVLACLLLSLLEISEGTSSAKVFFHRYFFFWPLFLLLNITLFGAYDPMTIYIELAAFQDMAVILGCCQGSLW